MTAGHAPVHGLNLYYERHGAGAPLILLHGGVVGIEMLRAIIPTLASDREVIAVELQGHGRTADIDRPLRFESMADDIEGLLGHLEIERADLMGVSLGGGVAMQTAIRHPDRVAKLVIVSEPFRRDGWYPSVLEDFERMGPSTAEPMWHSPLAAQFPEVDWTRLFTKLGELLRTDYDWSAEVSAIRSPMLVVFADADAVRLSHVEDFFGLLGGGQRDGGLDGSGRPAAQLAILPGRTHYDICATTVLAETVNGFLGRM